MSEATELKRWQLFDVSKIKLAPWNYKQEDEEKAQKLKAKLERNGQIVNINLRETKKGCYEVIDGNHRLIALQELGAEKVVAINHGKISQAEAARMAVELNEGDFQPDYLKLSALIKDLSEEWPVEDLLLTLPYTEEEIRDMIKIAGDIDWTPPAPEEGEGLDPDAGKWKDFNAKIPAEAWPIVEAELERIKEICNFQKGTEEVKNGLALEKICVLSAQTPTESLQ